MTFVGRMRWTGVVLGCGLLLLAMSACAHLERNTAPVAPIQPHRLEKFGDVRIDDYYWLNQRDSARVLDYLKAENAFTQESMRHTAALQKKLYEEMKSRIQESDLDVPVRIDDFYYYARTEAGKQYRIHCRKKGSLDAREEIILDENELATGSEYHALGGFEISPDHNLLAFLQDRKGRESYTLFIKNLKTGALLADRVEGLYYGLAWAADNRTLFYVVHDEAMRPFKVYRHRLGEPRGQDRLVFHEQDEAFFLSLWKSRSRQYLFIKSGSSTTDEIRFVPSASPEMAPVVIQPRQHKMEYSVAHHGDRFFIVTNDQATNFKLVQTPVDSPGKEHWKEVIAHDPEVQIVSAEAFKDHLVIAERRNGLSGLRVINLNNGERHEVGFSEPVYSCSVGDNPEFNTSVLRFNVASLITPNSIFDYDMNTRNRELKKEQPVLGGYDRTRYVSERVLATAADNTKVPISLVYLKGLKKDGQNPLLLAGYGSYGYSYEPRFNSDRFSFIDRGGVFAIAHVRGGGEMGRSWYDAGKLLNKKNTFTDFIACAEHLIAGKYTSADHLAITGGSAGGLLMGAVLNMRPDLFKAAVVYVPFVDVLTTMLDPSIPLTVTEYEEWGNPNEKKYYDYMKSYSPVDNVKAQAYPHMLVTAGLNDPRVQYWEPAKWVARLRRLKTDPNLLILKTEMGAGHSGSSGRYDKLQDAAFEYAFVLERLGVTE